MLATREIKKTPQVIDAAFMMGTDVNKALLEEAGLLNEDAHSALANDLIISIKCTEDGAESLDLAEALLTKHVITENTSTSKPVTFRSAIRANSEANMAVISIAGAYAAKEAREALINGLHVLLFSDNVSIDDEVALKKLAKRNGLLLMGPGAGTAIINGVGLGFANAVPKGSVGIVSAAGTGLQEVSTLLAKNGVGVSQGIGTGGRDLSKHVGGLMFFSAIDALLTDNETEMLVLISKPPDVQITRKLFKHINNCPKPVVMCLLGATKAEDLSKNIYFTRTLEECAYVSCGIGTSSPRDLLQKSKEQDLNIQQKYRSIKDKFTPEQKFIRALFSGGTLCYEAQVIWKDLLTDAVFSNAPLEKSTMLEDASKCESHYALDLGEEEFTVGRPHPMIDNDLRIQYIIKAACDPQTAVIVLDVVLGYGAHPDPGEELGKVIKKIIAEKAENNRTITFVASVTGTEDDPQSLSQTTQSMEDADVIVCNSNAQAARLAAFLVEN